MSSLIWDYFVCTCFSCLGNLVLAHKEFKRNLLWTPSLWHFIILKNTDALELAKYSKIMPASCTLCGRMFFGWIWRLVYDAIIPEAKGKINGHLKGMARLLDFILYLLYVQSCLYFCLLVGLSLLLFVYLSSMYRKTCLKQPLKKKTKNWI